MISSQSAKKIFLFVCNSNIFQIFSLLFRQSMIFLLYRGVRAEYILREHWNDVFECMKKDFIDMTWETSSRRVLESKNQELEFDVLNYWWSWCLMTQYWSWFNCYCCCSWDDQRYVERCFLCMMFFSLMI